MVLFISHLVECLVCVSLFPSQRQHGFNLGFYFLKSVDMKSTGIGKIIVEFFSAEMVFRVCR